MEETGVKRKLTVILAADVEGYSRLMGADELDAQLVTYEPGEPRRGVPGVVCRIGTSREWESTK